MRLYCYVDESGQDTQGRLFIVSVVVAADDRDRLIQILEIIEKETGKHRVKWGKTTYERRLAYIRRVLELAQLQGKVSFALYQNTRDYFGLTVDAIVRALGVTAREDYKITVLIDALPPTSARRVSQLLHRSGVHAKKVRGVIREESDALIRVADAMCSFVRDAEEGQAEMRQLFVQAIRRSMLRDLLHGKV